MAPLEITATRFRQSPGMFLDMADTGRPLHIKRGRGRLYTITPVITQPVAPPKPKYPAWVTPKVLADMEKARQQYKEGKIAATCRTKEESRAFLNSL